MNNEAYVVVGSGPAALMAADVLSAAGRAVEIYERRAGPGWKLLVAGSSGLNVTHDAKDEDFPAYYGARAAELGHCLAAFGKDAWLAHLHGLGEETYVGTSRRYFVKSFKASGLLKAWTERLAGRGVRFHYGRELARFSSGRVEFTDGSHAAGRAVVLALGGPSWEDAPSAWPEAFDERGIKFTPFTPANAGYSFRAPEGFFARAEGKPVKGFRLETARGAKLGEAMITRYGLEGTPIYTLGTPGPATLDLKPDVAEEKLAARLQPFRGDLRARLRGAKLSEGAYLLFEALADPAALTSAAGTARELKQLKLELVAARPLSESISARGGVDFAELSARLELKKVPGVFCAGEMVDWEAPTGGFLLQAAVSMGFVAGHGALEA